MNEKHKENVWLKQQNSKKKYKIRSLLNQLLIWRFGEN